LTVSTINGLPYGGQNLTVSSIKAVSSIISSLTVSTINGLPYGGGGGGWVSTAASRLNMNGYDIVDPSLLNISTPFLYLNGHTVTAITTSNAVIDAKQDIRFNSPNNIYMSTQTVDFQQSLLRGAVYGQSLGNYKPFQFIYEPPTAAGQSAEFAIQAHPQDAGVIYNLRYGIDLAAGSAYLFAEWPGYIVVPITISGQVVTLGQGEGVVANTNNYIELNSQGPLTISTLNTNIQSQSNINLTALSTNITSVEVTRSLNGAYKPQPVFQQGATSGSGASGNVSVTIPTPYTTSNSYQVFVTHTNASPPNTSVVRNTSNAFTIYWTNAGGGTQPFDWMTAGT